MPNVAVAVKEGASAFSLGCNALEDDAQKLKGILKSMNVVVFANKCQNSTLMRSLVSVGVVQLM